MKIPKDFDQLHKFFTLRADIMVVNGIPSLVIFSQNIRLITCKYVPTSTTGQLAKYLMKTVKLYARCGFVTRLVLMDTELKKVKDKVGLLEVNTTAARDHAVEIEKKFA